MVAIVGFIEAQVAAGQYRDRSGIREGEIISVRTQCVERGSEISGMVTMRTLYPAAEGCGKHGAYVAIGFSDRVIRHVGEIAFDADAREADRFANFIAADHNGRGPFIKY